MKNLLLSLILVALSIPSIAQLKEYPEARKNHTMVEIEGIIYMFGGESADKGDVLNELWAFDRGNNIWSKKTTPNPPEARENHTAVALDGKMYVHGGASNGVPFSDMWVYDPETDYWGKLETETAPPPKLYQKAIASEGQVFVTGGFDPNTSTAMADTWAFNPNYNSWTQKQDMPMPRYGHATFFKDLKVYVTAGRNEGGLMNDMYVYDIPQNSWDYQVTNGNPTPVKFSSYSSNQDVLFMTGGAEGSNGTFTDCPESWEYKFSDNTWTQKADGPQVTFGAGVISSDGKSGEYTGFFFGGSRNDITLDESWFYFSDNGWSMVGINEDFSVDMESFVYPSISNALFNVKAPNNIQSIQIYDISGKSIWQQNSVLSDELVIDLQGFPNGLYVISLESGNRLIKEKIIISK